MFKNGLIGTLLFIIGINFCSAQSKEQLYAQRLSLLKSKVELIYHPEVKKHIDAYLANPEKTKEIISLSKTFFPMIERALNEKHLPTDLKYLSVALSELDPQLQISSGASGIWLMGYNIAKMYKIKVNSFVDERKDPQISSNTVAIHLKDLFSIYRQWPLTIAAYTASPVMLNKSIRMAGNSMNFWDVYPFIPEGTREAYPKFIAAAYICNYYKEHGLKNIPPTLISESDSVLVKKWLSLQQIENTLEIPIDHLRKLNPIFKKDIIPYTINGYYINIPKNKVKSFYLLKDSVYKPSSITEEYASLNVVANTAETLQTNLPQNISKNKATITTKHEELKPAFDKKRLYYTVKKGDILNDIADWYDVTPEEIKSWNKLKSTKIFSGQKLTVWVKQNKLSFYKRINTMTPSQKKRLKRR